MIEGMKHLRPSSVIAENEIAGACTDGVWEDGLVIEDALRPVHERVDIFGRGKLRWALVAHAIFPKVFVSDS